MISDVLSFSGMMGPLTAEECLYCKSVQHEYNGQHPSLLEIFYFPLGGRLNAGETPSPGFNLSRGPSSPTCQAPFFLSISIIHLHLLIINSLCLTYNLS